MSVVNENKSGESNRPVVGRRRGVRAVGVLLGVSLLSGGAGWVAARQISSPGEVAARTKAPVGSRITAPVERRVLRSTLFTRGTVRFGSPRSVTLPASAAKTGSLVVTSPPKKGGEIVEGSKVADIGGRPVLVLQGKVPMYRDIRPGDQGDDVTALKLALGRLGFVSGSGAVYDAGAQRAVSAWLRSVGYEPFGPTEAQQDRLRTAADGVRKANEQVLAAKDALVKGVLVITPDKVVSADEAVRSAVERADAARRDGDRLVYAAEAALIAKRNQVDLAQIALNRSATDVSAVLSESEAVLAVTNAKQRVVDSDLAIEKAKRNVLSAQIDSDEAALAARDAQLGVDDANAGVVIAQAALDRVKAQGPRITETSPGVFTADFEGFNSAVAAAEAGIKQAGVQVRSASTALRAAQRAASKAVDAIGDSTTAVDTAVVAAAQAKEQVRIAELRLVQVKAGGSVSPSGGSGGSTDSGTPPAPASGGTGSSVAQLELALQTARAEFVQAEKSIESTNRSVSASIRSADTAVRIARLQRVELSKPASTASLRSAVVSAESGRTAADAELARLEATVGIVVPANELLFFDVLPLRIDDTKLAAGDAVSGSLMTVASKRVAVDASVDPSDATTLRPGQKAEIEATDLGITLPATITRVASTTGTDGADASRIYVEISPIGPAAGETAEAPPTTDPENGSFQPGRKPTLAELNGISVKVTIPISSTGGAVLAVPTPAVSAAADGTIRVEVEVAPGKPTKFVTVTAGLRAEGYVQVTPIEDGDLKEGDLVLTGIRDGEQLQGTLEPNDKPSSDSQPTDAPATQP